ncbi:MAG: bestrophin family ion channel [Myxococcota bacterium]
MLPALGAWAALLTFIHVNLGLAWLRLPSLVLSVLGTAVSFYLGFKGSSAYGRLWEARKIWGGIVNDSRTWGLQVTTFVSDLHRDGEDASALTAAHRDLVYRHIAWLAALRTMLRRRKSWEHSRASNDGARKLYGTLENSNAVLEERIEAFVPADELEHVMQAKNPATRLLHRQAEQLKALYAEERIEDFRHMQMMTLLQSFFALQGKCERIKNFPLPRQYASANYWFVIIFITLLPLGLLGVSHGDGLPEAFAWITVPGTMVLGWVFYVWDRVVDFSENPFEGLINDIPMDSLSRTIEIDMRQMLGETELPAALPPAAEHVAM